LVGVVGASRGVFGGEALVSTLVRLREEYGVEGFVIITTNRSGDFVSGALKVLEEFTGKGLGELLGDVRFERVCDWVTDRDCMTERMVGSVLERVLRDSERAIVSFTPSSRRLAAAIAMASAYAFEVSRREGGLAAPMVVHVDFVFGPWAGAPYPYVPRFLEPVIEILPPGQSGSGGENSIHAGLAGLFPDLSAEEAQRRFHARESGYTRYCRLPWGGRGGPLRCAVLELARRVNAASRVPVRISGGQGPSCSGEPLSISVRSELTGDEWRVTIEDPCDRENVLKGVRDLVGRSCQFLDELWEKLREQKKVKTHRRNAFRQLLYMSGLGQPLVKRCQGPACKPGVQDSRLSEALQSMGRPVVADTNMVYGGIHNCAGQGVQVLVPYCVFYEVTAIYAESSKGRRWLDTADAVLDTIAYYALEETLAVRGELVSSPIAHRCEAAIPSIDPIRLAHTVLATRDQGAYNLWSIHPATERLTLLYLDSPDCVEMQSRLEKLELGDIYYYLFQYLVMLRHLTRGRVNTSANGEGKREARYLTLDLRLGEKRIEVPLPKPPRG